MVIKELHPLQENLIYSKLVDNFFFDDSAGGTRLDGLGWNCCLKSLTYGAVLKALAYPQLFAAPQGGGMDCIDCAIYALGIDVGPVDEPKFVLMPWVVLD